jgi:hypothetical protein
VPGKPSEIQIMYGLAGERRLTELELPWLPGYENSSPVRIGFHDAELEKGTRLGRRNGFGNERLNFGDKPL